jgi:hypothetical protein
MLGISLSHDKLAQVVKTQQRTETWHNLVKSISSYHGTCETAFKLCTKESDQLRKVKTWISEYIPEQSSQ